MSKEGILKTTSVIIVSILILEILAGYYLYLKRTYLVNDYYISSIFGVYEYLDKRYGNDKNAISYEEYIKYGDENYVWPTLKDDAACGLCYTSGTTGNPKGVLYSHKSNVIHAQAALTAMTISPDDSILMVVPLFHVLAWGIPYFGPMLGLKLVMPGMQMEGDVSLGSRADVIVPVNNLGNLAATGVGDEPAFKVEVSVADGEGVELVQTVINGPSSIEPFEGLKFKVPILTWRRLNPLVVSALLIPGSEDIPANRGMITSSVAAAMLAVIKRFIGPS